MQMACGDPSRRSGWRSWTGADADSAARGQRGRRDRAMRTRRDSGQTAGRHFGTFSTRMAAAVEGFESVCGSGDVEARAMCRSAPNCGLASSSRARRRTPAQPLLPLGGKRRARDCVPHGSVEQPDSLDVRGAAGSPRRRRPASERPRRRSRIEASRRRRAAVALSEWEFGAGLAGARERPPRNGPAPHTSVRCGGSVEVMRPRIANRGRVAGSRFAGRGSRSGRSRRGRDEQQLIASRHPAVRR